MLLPSDFYFYAIPAILLVGLSKGGFGGAIGMLGVPILALVISPIQAAAILLPILILMDLVGLYLYRGKGDRSVLKKMIPAACLGIAAGWLLADQLNENVIRFAVGLTALAFVLDYLYKRAKNTGTGSTPPSQKSTNLSALFWGSISGLTSFIAHAGGPPYQIHTLRLGLDKIRFAATAVYFFTIVNAIKLIPYFALGQFSTENLSITLTLLPLAPISIMMGVYLVRKISQEHFYGLTYAAIFVIALKLMWDSLSSALT